MIMLFALAALLLYGSFKVYNGSKIRWALFEIGFVIISTVVSQLTVRFSCCRPCSTAGSGSWREREIAKN
ncbi:hypothetical protein [Thermococcus chitonophagus]|uniref:hypothetical protein n=1 Tax=Thermococcus chitonophagus TaxID=54262 RepID=UPI0012EE172F|nr:hypothetical protein [Thermococcus chitonophagus]